MGLSLRQVASPRQSCRIGVVGAPRPTHHPSRAGSQLDLIQMPDAHRETVRTQPKADLVKVCRLSPPAQSYPQTLRMAVGASPRILYWTVTDVRRPLRPGAFFGAVCPPDFKVPTSVNVSSLRLSQ